MLARRNPILQDPVEIGFEGLYNHRLPTKDQHCLAFTRGVQVFASLLRRFHVKVCSTLCIQSFFSS
jgi:hypothetical protein